VLVPAAAGRDLDPATVAAAVGADPTVAPVVGAAGLLCRAGLGRGGRAAVGCSALRELPAGLAVFADRLLSILTDRCCARDVGAVTADLATPDVGAPFARALDSVLAQVAVRKVGHADPVFDRLLVRAEPGGLVAFGAGTALTHDAGDHAANHLQVTGLARGVAGHLHELIGGDLVVAWLEIGVYPRTSCHQRGEHPKS